MWFTPMNGTSHASASDLAADTPDQQRSDQPRTDGAGDRVDSRVVDAGLDDRTGDHRIEDVEMGTRRDLGDDPAEVGVQVDLGRHHARHHVVATHHQGGRGLVAARLDAEDERRLVDRHPRSRG